MKNLWEKLLGNIKEVLVREYHLDMDGSDERFAYVIYVMMMSANERKLPKEWLKEAYELAPTDYWRKEKVPFPAFQRGIYHTLHRIDNVQKNPVFDFFAVVLRVIEKVKA